MEIVTGTKATKMLEEMWDKVDDRHFDWEAEKGDTWVKSHLGPLDHFVNVLDPCDNPEEPFRLEPSENGFHYVVPVDANDFTPSPSTLVLVGVKLAGLAKTGVITVVQPAERGGVYFYAGTEEDVIRMLQNVKAQFDL